MVEWNGSEADRLAVLDRYDLDPERIDALNDITRFLAALCETPIALVSLVEENRQRFLARTGLDAPETPRDMSFCAHAMLLPDVMLVPDASQDSRFADNAMVTGPPHIRFYAGAPLVSPEGVPLGSLCVIDDKPRAGLTPVQRQGLELLSHRVVAMLEARRRDIDWDTQRSRDVEALSHSELRFRTLADAMPQMVWSTLPDGYHDYYNARWYEFTGMPQGSTDGEGWNGMFHPDDQDLAWQRWRQSLATGDPYEIEYRLRHKSGLYRWTLGRALPLRDPQGMIVRWIGTCTDIHEQKLMIEEREIIAHELSHRIKNIFSVIAGLIGMSARERPEIAPLAEELRERVMALGRAHDFVRPHSANSASEGGQNSLFGLLGQIFAPYRSGTVDRVVVGGVDIEIDDRSATPLALVFHELATNAAKYGGLAYSEGGVSLDVGLDGDQCLLHWNEHGGPQVRQPDTGGFGTRLMALSIERQLGGKIARDWREDGLDVRLRIPLRAMSR